VKDHVWEIKYVICSRLLVIRASLDTVMRISTVNVIIFDQ